MPITPRWDGKLRGPQMCGIISPLTVGASQVGKRSIMSFKPFIEREKERETDSGDTVQVARTIDKRFTGWAVAFPI